MAKPNYSFEKRQKEIAKKKKKEEKRLKKAEAGNIAAEDTETSTDGADPAPAGEGS
ncbi:MAG: hypothetical protein V7742_20825 [Halioglobus sp.]